MSTGRIQPGAHPPLLIPTCARCGQPVEEMKFDATTSPFYLGIQVSCCGYTSGARISVDKVFELQRSKEKFVMNGAGSMPQLRDPLRHRRVHG